MTGRFFLFWTWAGTVLFLTGLIPSPAKPAEASGPFPGSDLVLWLDGQSINGKTQVLTPPSQGTPVGFWRDRSGHGNHAVQDAARQRPSLAPAALGHGIGVVHFEARERQFLSVKGGPSLNLQFLTAFVVARAMEASSDMWLFSKNHWGPPWTGYGIAVSREGLRPWPHLGLKANQRGYLKLEENLRSSFRIIEVVYDGTTLKGLLDGEIDSTQQVHGPILDNEEKLCIGTLGGQYLQGDIAEILLYRRALTDRESKQTRTYLAGKYGLSVSPLEPSGSPVVKDWLFQAKGHSLAERIHQEVTWARQLAARLARNPRTPDLGSDLAELDRLASWLGDSANPNRNTLNAVGPSSRAGPATRPARLAGPAPTDRELYLAVRQVKRRLMFKNPRVDFQRLLLIDQPYPHGSEWPHQAIHRLGHRATPGGRLLILEGLDPNAPIRDLGLPGAGSYWRPDLSFDARRIVFCYKSKDEKSFHLYERNLDGTGLRQLTRGDYDDIDPLYLPDGHILFTTTRGNSYVRCGPYIYSYVLARCDPDGGNIYLLSQNNEPDFVPALLSDGRVIYSRWEYTDKSVFRVQSLWTTYPDGTGTMAFWGNQSVWPDHLAEPRPIPGSRRVMFSAVGHHDWFTGSLGIVDPSKGFNFPHGLTRVTCDLPWTEVTRPPEDRPEAADYHASGPYTSYKTPFPLSEEDFLVSARGQGGRFRLYLMDVHGNRELIYEGTHNVWHALPIKPRRRPLHLPDRVAWPGTGTNRQRAGLGHLYCADVYQGVPDLPRGSVKYLRVVQSDAKTYSTWFKTFRLSGPPVSIVYEESVKRILGTVPVEADGSVSFLVPPGQALHFQLLDEQNRCLQTMRSFTGVMPGEQRGCVGCHESQVVAPLGKPGLALRRPPAQLTPPPWGTASISYEDFAQPVLDRYCGTCHQGKREARKQLDLTLRPGVSVFKEPYLTLVGSAGWQNPVPNRGQPGYGIAGAIPVETMDETKNDPRGLATMPPRSTLSYTSRLVEIASSGNHYGVKADPLSLQRLMAWVDMNCPYMSDEQVRALPDPDFPGIEQLPIRPRVKTAPVIKRP